MTWCGLRLDSANGTYANEERVQAAELEHLSEFVSALPGWWSPSFETLQGLQRGLAATILET